MHVIQNCHNLQICIKGFARVYFKNRQLQAGMILAIIKEKTLIGQEIINSFFKKDRQGL
jgi:hypothetical protein